MKVSMADYLVGLFLKYSFRAALTVVGLCLVFEVAMQLENWRAGEPLTFYVYDLLAEVVWAAETGKGFEENASFVVRAVMGTVVVWALTVMLVVGFGIPLGLILGRLGCAGKREKSVRRLTAKLALVPCSLLIGLPAFGLAAWAVLYLIDFAALPVFTLMENGGQGFGGDDVQVAGWLRLILPAGVVALPGTAWLARSVVRILWVSHDSDFVHAAEDRGLSGEHLFYHYVVKNSLSSMGGAALSLLPVLLGSLILVEWVFRFPGLGDLMRTAAFGKEFLLLSIGAGLSGLMVMSGSFLIEVIFGVIDKSTRAEGGVGRSGNREMDHRVTVESDRVRRVKRLKLAWIFVLGISGLMWGGHLFAEFSWKVEGKMGAIERLLAGASGTLAMALISSVLAVFVSFCVAGFSGCMGGWRAYCLIAKTHTAMISIPSMLWLFFGLAIAGSGFWSTVLIVTCVGGLLGAGVLSRYLLEMEFQGWIESARAIGLNRRQIFFRHFIPAIWPRLVSRGLTLLPVMLVFTVAADFSGLTAKGNGSNRWGVLMAEGKAMMLDDPVLLIVSVGMVWMTATAFAALATWARFEKGDRTGPDIY